jgi:hypothetical protein
VTWKRCDVCSHPARVAIEKAMNRVKVGGSLQFIADRYGTTNDQLIRHRDEHLGKVPAVVSNGSATVVHSRMDPAALFEEHNDCIRECQELITFAKEGGDTRGWALGVREWRGCLDQKNKMLGLYDQVDPRLQRAFMGRVIEVVSRALEQFPDAKQQVLAAIDEVEKGDG